MSPWCFRYNVGFLWMSFLYIMSVFRIIDFTNKKRWAFGKVEEGLKIQLKPCSRRVEGCREVQKIKTIKTEKPVETDVIQKKKKIIIWEALPMDAAAAKGSGQRRSPTASFGLLRISPSFPWLLPTNLYFEGSLQEILCFLQYSRFISVHITLLFPLIGSKSLGWAIHLLQVGSCSVCQCRVIWF